MTQIQERINICIAKIIQQSPQVKNIFDEIYQQGGRVLLVGGTVRDCLLGCLSCDLDFEVYHLSFDHLQDILQKFGKVSFIGKSFGVLRLHGFDADWSIPRTDSYGRKPTVQLDPDMSFEQAFRRRDVTVNSMGIDVSSLELVDPYDGLSDLTKKVLRTADVTFFVQDPLRLFRVMQLCARFDMKVDETLSQVCKTMDISDVSVERIEQEFFKLFTKSQHPSKGFVWMQYINRLNDIFPAITFDKKFYERLDAIAQHHKFTPEQKNMACFALIAQGLPDDALSNIAIDQKMNAVQMTFLSSFLKKYIGSIDLISKAAKLSWYVRYVPLIAKLDNPVAYKWLAHWIGSDFDLQFLGEVASCWYSQELVEKFVIAAKNAKVLHHEEEPLLTGADLLSQAQGKELGDLIKKAYELQLQDAIHDKSKLLKKIIKK
ncbi:CCA tRNA nucleotidyltransferase [Candidatus Babeliales bacterium]|nr:CCA tRNA nucleotidyltransferase [Candidatus Babeliales bacterium]